MEPVAEEAYDGPYQIINTALNLVTGENLAWQERRAASFAFTPHYSGFEVEREPGVASVGDEVEADGFGHGNLRLPTRRASRVRDRRRHPSRHRARHQRSSRQSQHGLPLVVRRRVPDDGVQGEAGVVDG